MNTRFDFRFLVAALAALTALTAAAADLTVIELRNRRADEVLPVIRPLVSPEVALSGIDYKLLVRGSAADVARIREALAVLDRTPRQLMISVRYSANPQSNVTTLGAAGSVSAGGSQIALSGGVTASTSSDNSVSSVRVLEGNGAHISTGQSVPIVTTFLSPRSSRQPVVGVSTNYRELTSGFDVLPRINGDRVILDITTQEQRASDLAQGSATVQHVNTTVAGKLGDWIDLGGVTSSVSEQSTGIGIGAGARRVATQSDQRTIAVKVEQVD